MMVLVLMLAGCAGSGGSDSPGSGGSSGGAAGSASGGKSSGGSGQSGSAGKSTFDCTSSAEPGEMVAVPEGEFAMGCNEAVDSDCLSDEKPMHMVSLSAFEIDRTEVTQDQYVACVAAGACAAPSCSWSCDRTDFPASCVLLAEAEAYCSWAGKRLPSEAEWEKAARGGSGDKYPWGNTEPDCALANMASCGGVPRAVGGLPAGASPYGALDMAGNMVEMVTDWYDASYYAVSPSVDAKGPETGTRYGGRGGGFKSDAAWQRTSKRDWYDLSDFAAALGFRCAR